MSNGQWATIRFIYNLQIKIYYIFEILQSCHPLPWCQLCTLLAISQPASPGMLFQQSWRSSHICWALVGCFSFTLRSNSSQTISIGLRSGDCGGQVIWCSTHHSPSCSNSPNTAWRCVGSLSCWKQMRVPLSANQMGWRIAAECCGSHAG